MTAWNVLLRTSPSTDTMIYDFYDRMATNLLRLIFLVLG